MIDAVAAYLYFDNINVLASNVGNEDLRKKFGNSNYFGATLYFIRKIFVTTPFDFMTPLIKN